MNEEEKNEFCSSVCKQIENIQDELCFFFYKLGVLFFAIILILVIEIHSISGVVQNLLP